MYHIVYAFLYLLSLLPWFIIYAISDVLFFFIYHVVGYRKQIVLNNLTIAFPEKSIDERTKIAKEFYRTFTDTLLEILKLISISEAEINKRFACNYEVVNNLAATGQNIQLLGGHFFNWEFLNLAYAKNFQIPFLGIYLPLTSKVFNRIMYQIRGKFGTGMIAAGNFNREFYHLSKGRFVLAVAGDQNPVNLSKSFWLPLFGKMTPFVDGPERIALAKNTAIVFTNFYRIKRGYYQSEFILLTTTPKELPKGAITLAFRDFLETEIKKRPANFLWSHRRWKHEFDAEKYGHLVIESPK